jgi:signal transduction histidine kinase
MQRGVQEQVELLACLEDLARLLRKKDQASGPIDLVDLVRGMVDDLRPSAAASQVELALVLPATSAKVQVTGVREPIKRALRSLVLQALRHSPRHSTIELRLCDESDGAVFIVTDKGEPPSNLAASHSVARLRRASMIGEPRSSDLDFLLAHASLVIRHNGGRMAAHPGPGGHGTVLVVTLPRAGSPASVE